MTRSPPSTRPARQPLTQLPDGTEPVGHSYHEQAAPWMTITLADQPAQPPAAP